MEETDPWGFPSPLPEAHLSRDSGFEIYQDRGRSQEQFTPSISTDHTPPSWRRRILRYNTYALAICSILLPAAFLGLGIAIAVANGKSVSSSWVVLFEVVGVLSTLWPVILAAVVVQALVSWMTVRARRYQAMSLRGEAIRQPFDRSHVEAICMLLFMGLTVSPPGSLALRSVFGTDATTVQTQVGVWYVDRTGQNELWSENSNSTLSNTSRLELIQTVGEKYARSLLLNVDGPTSNHATTNLPAITQAVLRSRDAPTGLQNVDASPPDPSSHGEPMPPPTEHMNSQIALEMTTSYFDLMCADWDLAIRDFEDFTVPSKMSYSISQTLGMSMSAGAGKVEFPTGNVTVASLNKIVQHGTLALDERWEYSMIRCSWTQLFYNVPVQCDWDRHAGLSNCLQNGDSQLLLNPDALSGTQLGDFADDFVLSGNVPTTERIATASKYSMPRPTTQVQILTSIAERYIQNGGPVQLDSLNLESNGTGLLNLSATVTPSDFAQRFGQLFNTWVALGYCPQCSPEIAVGNHSVVPTDLRQQYRQTTSTLSRPGPPHITVHWGWEAVILAFGLILLASGIIAIVFEYGQTILPSYSCCGRGRRQTRQPGAGDLDGMMRMLLGPANSGGPAERYPPMPRRPVTNTPAAAVMDHTKNLGRQISAHLSRMSGVSFMLPIQGTRLPQHGQSANATGTAATAAGAAEASDPNLHRVSSAEFFSRRYSKRGEERSSPPRRRSVSENPPKSQRRISLRHSLFRDSWMPAARLDGFEKMGDHEEGPGAFAFGFGSGGGGGGETSGSGGGSNKRRGEEGVNNRGRKHVRISSVWYRAPPQGGQGGQRPQGQQHLAAPESPEKSSEGPSWIYDEYMTNKL